MVVYYPFFNLHCSIFRLVGWHQTCLGNVQSIVNTEPFAVLFHFVSWSIWIRCFCLSLWLFLHIQWECCGISCGGPMQALLAVLQQWSFLDVQQWGCVHHQQTGCNRFGTSDAKTLSMPSAYGPTAFGCHCFKDYLLIAIKKKWKYNIPNVNVC